MNDFFVLVQLISCDQSDLDEGFSDAMCYISITCLYYIVPFFWTGLSREGIGTGRSHLALLQLTPDVLDYHQR